ncbi:TPA: indolepyruvate oxidoreductase, partial [Candidatus Geothermarchaeota archaeon]|nr:indolepyruvate oxidoreductase [Candidatus Geothermarchaeota archaeon]
MEYNILFAGVGGQGIITLGRLIGSALTNSGFNVLMAETHGLSQRGGSVTVHMRVGDVNSPLVPLGGADLLVGLELIEAVRNLGYLSRDGVKIVNDYIMRPSIPK